MGARVFGIASGEDGIDLAERLGAEVAVDEHNGNILSSAREFARKVLTQVYSLQVERLPSVHSPPFEKEDGWHILLVYHYPMSRLLFACFATWEVNIGERCHTN